MRGAYKCTAILEIIIEKIRVNTFSIYYVLGSVLNIL